jgi:hypothetical protein
MATPSVATLNRLVLFALDWYESRNQSGATPVEITWLLGQETHAESEIRETLDYLVKEGIAATRDGLYYCVDFYGLDKKDEKKIHSTP